MEPEGSSKSELFGSLKLYLNQKNRLQPIIGLESIIECVNVSTPNRETLFLCEVCVCRLNKADMRNHILGSLHRFNYIKACYPHLVSKWQANSDLSKLAWPLMELAKMLEGKDGPGDIQLFEVEDDVYQKMATQSENHAIALINILRDELSESRNFSGTTSLHYPVTSDRVVLIAEKQATDPKQSYQAATESLKMPTHTSKFLPEVPGDVAPPAMSKVWFKSKLAPQLEIMQTSPEPSVLEYRNDFFDDYSGDKPLIGLARVVEFRSEDGCSYCFLCHCCRIRSNKKDIIDHLFSSSHLINYLMETHSDEMEIIGEDIEEDCQLLQSLAKKVEQDEGRGELKVVQVPESQCRQLTGKSYHWCLRMLSSGWTHSDMKNKGKAFQGAGVNTTSEQRMSEKSTILGSKWPKREKQKKRMKKMTNTVFNVCLPLPRGEMLLQGRTSFSMDNLLESPVSSPDPETVDCRVECDTSPFVDTHVEETSDFQTSPLQQDLYQGNADAGQYIPGHNSDTAFQDVDGYDRRDMCFNQFQDAVGIENAVYGEWMYNRHHGSHETSSHDAPTQSEEWFPAPPHAKDRPPHYFYSRQQVGDCRGKTEEEVPRWERDYEDMNASAVQHHQQQQYQRQQTAWANSSNYPGMWGYPGMYGDAPPHLDPARNDMQARSGSAPLYGGGVPPEAAVPFHYPDLNQMQTCTLFAVNHFQAVPQNYMTQSAAYQASQAEHRLTSAPNYNFGPWSNSMQHFAYPASSNSNCDMMQANAVIQPGQPLYH